MDSWRGTFADPSDGQPTDVHGIRIIYRVRLTGGELRDEIGGSSDTCRWVTRTELAALPRVELAHVGARLAFGTA